MKNTVEINLETLTKQVNDGMKKDALAKHYGLPVTQMTKALKDAGLKIRKFHKPAFVLVDGSTKKDDSATTGTDAVNTDTTDEVATVNTDTVTDTTAETDVATAPSGMDAEKVEETEEIIEDTAFEWKE